MANNEPQPIISQGDVEKLLGRSLSTTETENYELYLSIAQTRLEDLLCYELKNEVLPVDLELLLARCFGVISTEQNVDGENISSKKIEDYSITYDTTSEETPMSKFVKLNQSIIAKYSNCETKIECGDICYDNYLHFI